jgi:hypothetical protein
MAPGSMIKIKGDPAVAAALPTGCRRFIDRSRCTLEQQRRDEEHATDE